jgi:adenylate cyclase
MSLRLIVILLMMSVACGAQTPLLDSLEQELARARTDTTRALLLAEMAWELKVSEPDSARQLLDRAIQLSRQRSFAKGEATAHNYYGVLETIHGQVDEAIRRYESALPLRQQIGDTKGVASIHNNLGNIYVRQGDNIRALTHYQRSLEIMESIGDTARIARANYSIAQAYMAMSNYPEALNHLYEYLDYAEQMQDDEAIATGLNMIGGVKAEIELTEEALSYFERVRTIRERLADPQGLAIAYRNLGVSETNLGERIYDQGLPDSALVHYARADTWFDKALRLYEDQELQSGIAAIFLNKGILLKNRGSALRKTGRIAEARDEWDAALQLLATARELRTGLGETAGLVEVLNALGDVYRRLERYELALNFTREYMTLAEQTGQAKFIRTGYKDLARVYAQMGRWKEAYEARKKYDELRWEEFNERRIQDYERREVMYGDMKKQRRLEKQEQELALQEARLREARLRQIALLGGAAALMILAFLLYNRYRIKARANRELADKNAIIQTERDKSDRLLLNILPAQTAEELKQTGRAQARHYDSVSVLFTDFVGFTEVAAVMSADQLVEELDTCFRAFDGIIDRHGLEKIKTIGDAYLCVGGLPAERDDHAAAVVAAARDMQDWIEARASQRRAQGLPAFRMRIGIHSGPVIAGVVGDRKFAYDIWGDTVNTAARMESNSEPGRINISAATRQLLNGAFTITSRGAIQAKGKGEMEMFWVNPNRALGKG